MSQHFSVVGQQPCRIGSQLEHVRLISSNLGQKTCLVGPLGERIQIGIDDHGPGITEYEQHNNCNYSWSNARDGHVLAANVRIAGNQSVWRRAHW